MKVKNIAFPLFVLILIGIYSFEIKSDLNPHENDDKLYKITTKNTNDLKDFFKFTPDRLPIVSVHRGGPRKGFPENCIETFVNTLSHTHAILEVDPRYTKDGHIILMHDPTVDRTTNGRGKVSDFTLEEIRKLRLKDTEGNLTDYRIPTLDEALQWAKGKTILVIDAKDVPIEQRVEAIVKNKAEANAIVIAYSMEDIRKAYRVNKNIVMEIIMGKMENVTAIDDSGIPWENFVAFVSHDLPQNQAIYNAVHKRGSMCIQGTSRNYDRQYILGEISEQQLYNGYREIIENGADIIEADLGIEAGEALKNLRNENSSKSKYFN